MNVDFREFVEHMQDCGKLPQFGEHLVRTNMLASESNGQKSVTVSGPCTTLDHMSENYDETEMQEVVGDLFG